VEMSPTHPPNAHCMQLLVKSIPRRWRCCCPLRVTRRDSFKSLLCCRGRLMVMPQR
jgi:hypothetical protein